MIVVSLSEIEKSDIHEVKYVGIGDKVYAISLISLEVHCHKYDVRYGDLTITQELLDDMPPPTRKIDHADEAFLRRTPIVMFESVLEDGRYWRFDGRHRIWAAHKLGLTEVPAIWCSREVWGCFIIGHKVSKDRPIDRLDDETIPRWEYVPHSWDESPARRGLDRLEPDFHLEPNFDLPDRTTKLDPNRYSSFPALGLSSENFNNEVPRERKILARASAVQPKRSNSAFRLG